MALDATSYHKLFRNKKYVSLAWRIARNLQWGVYFGVLGQRCPQPQQAKGVGVKPQRSEMLQFFWQINLVLGVS